VGTRIGLHHFEFARFFTNPLTALPTIGRINAAANGVTTTLQRQGSARDTGSTSPSEGNGIRSFLAQILVMREAHGEPKNHPS
jgi:hypothetical protein